MRRIHLGMSIGLAIAALCPTFALPASAAALRALVIGIDKYVLDSPRNNLDGAVNDARDIEQALRRAGANEVILLTDEKASKGAIEKTWFQLVDRAQPGDTVVFTYAGHGSQEPAPAGATDEGDGLNENFILGGFTSSGPGTAERVVDDEMNLWLKRADDRGLRVVFIADSCHAGSMTRALGADAESRIKFRNLPRSTVTLPPPEDLPPPAVGAMKPSDFRNVVFVGAALENQKTPEVTIEGKTRGALSWAFARALEGAADTDRNGVLSQDELLTYLKLTVYKLVESQQTPELLPLRSADRPLLPVVKSETAPPAAAAAIAEEKQVLLRVAMSGGSVPIKLRGVEVVSDPASADLVWTLPTGIVRHRIGGVVAEGVDAALWPAVVAKWLSLEVLKAASKESVNAEITSGNHAYRRGERVRFEIRNNNRPFLTVFNLPPSGRVDYLLPSERERSKDWRNRAVSEDFVVKDPPFGAEHVVAILSNEPLTALQTRLMLIGSPERMMELPGLLENALGRAQIAVAIVPLYTSSTPCRKARDGPRCETEY